MAISKYKAIEKIVKLFSVRSAELGEPNKLLFVAKLANPLFCGARKNIMTIRKMLSSIQNIFNIII